MKKNSPKVWDAVWEMYSPQYLKYLIENEVKMLKYKKIFKIIKDNFSSLKNLKCIEIGAGIGTYSIYLAKLGSNVTIFDYSDQALEYSKKIFNLFNLHANFIKADALSLPNNLISKYDLCLSFGLSEHFKGSKRVSIFKSHTDLLKPNGLFINQVPNKYSFPYRIHMKTMRALNAWPYGEEYPFSRSEIIQIMHKIGQKNFGIEGDGFLNSLDFLNIFRIINKTWTLRHVSFFQKETFLDKNLSYSHIIYGKKLTS